MKIFNEYNFKLLDGTGATEYDFGTAFYPDKLTPGRPDTATLTLADSVKRVTRQGDNIFIPESYVLHGVVSATTFSSLRSSLNAIRDALADATEILVTLPSTATYKILILPVSTVNHHVMVIKPISGYTVSVDIYFNTSSAISTYTPGVPSNVASGYAFWINSRNDLYTDTGGTTAVSANDDPVRHAGDQSTNDNDATQTGISSNIPLYKTSVDGTTTIFCQGGSNGTSFGGFLQTDSNVGAIGTLYAVVKPITPVTNTTTQVHLIGAPDTTDSTNGAYDLQTKVSGTDPQAGTVVFRDGYNAGLPQIRDKWVLISIRINPTDGLRVELDGLEYSTDATVTTLLTPKDYMLIGACFNTTVTRNKFQGHIADVLVYNTDVSDADHSANKAYFNSIHSTRITVYENEPTELIQDNLVRNWKFDTDVFTDAGNTVASIDDAVQQVNDQSTNANHLNQTTSANRGTLRSIDGITAVEFDGTNDFYPHSYTSDPRTIYALIKPTDATSKHRHIMGLDDNGTSFYYRFEVSRSTDSLMQFNVRVVNPEATITKIANSWFLLCARWNPSTLDTTISDGTNEATDNTATGTAPGKGTFATVGSGSNNGGALWYFKGYIAEIAVYDVEHDGYDEWLTRRIFATNWSVL